MMQGEAKERWFQLCQLAAAEQDSDRLLNLVREINRLLDDKESRLSGKRRERPKVDS